MAARPPPDWDRSQPSLADLQGEWISAPYLEEVRRTRQTLAPQLRWPALAFAIEPADEGGYALFRTNFHEEIRQPIEGLEWAGTGSARLTVGGGVRPESLTLRFPGPTGVPATLRVAEVWPGTPEPEVAFVRPAAGLRPEVNRAVLAGDYTDETGARYRFTAAGRATWPDRAFDYTLSLDPTEACCEYFQHPDPAGVGGVTRYGYRWRGDRLALFRVLYPEDGCPISCAPEPFLVLSPVR